jgi:hypothetical protein
MLRRVHQYDGLKCKHCGKGWQIAFAENSEICKFAPLKDVSVRLHTPKQAPGPLAWARVELIFWSNWLKWAIYRIFKR